MVTAKVESEDVVEALELGANDYVTKPIDFAIASARVQSQVARLKAERAAAHHVQKLERINAQLEHEIAERKQSEAIVRYMAQHDSLTGLGNRVQFRDQLVRALARVEDGGGKLALLFIDLDQFKLHQRYARTSHRRSSVDRGRPAPAAFDAGLRYRRASGRRRIRHHSARQGTGGGCRRSSADRIIKAIAQPYQIEGHQLLVSCSIGIAWAPDDGTDPDLLLANADLALYRAKAEARGGYRFFEVEMNARAQARRLLERDLRDALQPRPIRAALPAIVQSQRRAASPASRRWCAGTIRCAASSRRSNSYRSRKKWA